MRRIKIERGYLQEFYIDSWHVEREATRIEKALWSEIEELCLNKKQLLAMLQDAMVAWSSAGHMPQSRMDEIWATLEGRSI